MGTERYHRSMRGLPHQTGYQNAWGVGIMPVEWYIIPRQERSNDVPAVLLESYYWGSNNIVAARPSPKCQG